MKSKLDQIVTIAPFCSFLLLFFDAHHNHFFFLFVKSLWFVQFVKKNENFVTIKIGFIGPLSKKGANALFFL
jgi:hypothetical protein